MKKRWDAIAETTEGEEIRIVLRGANEEEARKAGLEYKGIQAIQSLTERTTEKTFPQPPAHLIGIHYRPLRRDGKVLYG